MTTITTGPDGQPLFDGMTTEALARAMENDALALGASGLLTPADTLDTAAAALRHLSAQLATLDPAETLEAKCEDCRRPYGKPGFPDLVIPDADWKRISTTRDEGGLLCPSCICARLECAGIETTGQFRSGPLALSLRHLSEWQPIETAPRDGRELDIWVVPPTRREPGDYPIYAGACSQRIPNVRPCYTHAWQDDRGLTVTGRRFYDDDLCIDPDDTSERATRATHWRPLPPPPKGTEP